MIYDVRQDWLAWGWGVVLLLAVVATPRMSSEIVRQWRTEGFRSLISQPGFIIEWMAPALAVTLVLVSGVLTFEQLRLHAIAADGRYTVAEAVVAHRQFNCHQGRGGRTCIVFIALANDWYRLPYVGPPECLPMEGERARLWSLPTADVALPGKLGMARRVLRVELLQACHVRLQ